MSLFFVRMFPGSAVELALIRFRAVTGVTGLTSINGTISTLNSLGTASALNGVPIGAPSPPRPFVAGAVRVLVTATRRRRFSYGDEYDVTSGDEGVADGDAQSDGTAPPSSSFASRPTPLDQEIQVESGHVMQMRSSPHRRQVATCQQPPCATCSNTTSSGSVNGDANGDCVFDIGDISFSQL